MLTHFGEITRFQLVVMDILDKLSLTNRKAIDINRLYGASVMSENVTYEKAKAFALKIIAVCKRIQKEEKEYILTNQIIRSATSVGANIAESKYAQSNADFISKLQIALKECAESEYWIDIMSGAGYLCSEEYDNLYAECGRLRKLLSSAIMTASKRSH